MGPNGSGKTTLGYALMGHPAYVVTSGEVLWKGRNLLKLSPGQARPPRPVPRLPVPDRDPGPVASPASSARAQREAPGHRQEPRRRPDGPAPRRHLDARLPAPDAREDGPAASWTTASRPATSTRASRAARRSASRCSRWPMLEPEFAILDETDSGLDIDALRIVAEGVNAQLNPNLGVLLITHYQRLLNYITPGLRPRPGGRPDRHSRAAGTWRCGSRRRATARSCARPASRSTSRTPTLAVPRSPRRPPPGRDDAMTTIETRPAESRPPAARPPAGPGRAPRRLPDPRPATSAGTRWSTWTRAATLPEAARRARGARRLLPPRQRQRPSRHLRDRARRPRPRTRAPAQGRAAPQRPGPARDRLDPQRDRGDQPRRLRLGPPATSAGATRSCSRSWSTTRTSSRGSSSPRRRTRTSSSWRSPTTASCARSVRGPAPPASPSWSRSPTCRTRSGTINPVEEMTRRGPRGRRAGAHRWRPGRPAPAGRRRRRSARDFYVFCGHKALGPTGSGVLWARRELLEAMPPFMGGGEMIREVHLRRSDWNDVPWKFEAGTPDIAAPDRARRRADYLRRPRAWTASASTSATSSSTRSSCCRARCRASALRPAGPTIAAASSRSTSRASTRTTSAQVLDRRRRRPGRPSLHAAAPRAARPRRHRARLVPCLHHA